MMPGIKRELHLHTWAEIQRPTFDRRIRRCISCGAMQAMKHGEWIAIVTPLPSSIETR